MLLTHGEAGGSSGPHSPHTRLMRDDFFSLFGKGQSSPTLAGWIEGIQQRKQAGKRNAKCSCVKLLLSLPRPAAQPWQALARSPPEASASSTDRAADGTHLSADDILIYLSLTDGTMPWFLAGVQSVCVRGVESGRGGPTFWG